MGRFLRIEDLDVYQKLCRLHIEVCLITDEWPRSERYELTSQIRRSSNGAPANLAEKHSDRHVRNKIEGVNRARGQTLETIHHMYMALLKGYVRQDVFDAIRVRYEECVRMLNGTERTLEKQLPHEDRRFPDLSPKPSTLNPEPIS